MSPQQLTGTVNCETLPQSNLDPSQPPSECLALPSQPTYKLPGPQIEPEASFWTIGKCKVPCVIDICRLTRVTDDPNPNNPCFFPPFPTDPAVVRDEIEELVELASLRDDPDALVSTKPCRERREISPFLQYRPQPLSAAYNLDRDPAAQVFLRGGAPEPNLVEIYRGEEYDARYPVIRTGRELARWFENNTPGLAHRHALNYLLRDTDWSPPRQAWVWAALDITIYSALLAAWYYKWFAGIKDEACRQSCYEPFTARQDVSYRPRPFELDSRVGVLYNREISRFGDGDGPRRPTPNPSPGTPRHPSYPSGHSTYGAAASELLSWFFPDYREELNRLADNTGMARLWAGIHYRSDHIQGMKLGRCVACMIIEDLKMSFIARTPDECNPPCPNSEDKARGRCDPPPTEAELCELAKERKACCEGEERPPQDRLDPLRNIPRSSQAQREQARSPQRGAR
jgi:hypothetical protein